ncbi:MAG: hemagglutinin repeat-containing protein, partial [Opitutales bacterium]
MKKVFWLIAVLASFASSKLLADTYDIDLNKTSNQYVLQIKRFNPVGVEVGNVRYTFFKKTDKLKQTSLYFQGKEAPWAPLDRSVAGGLGIRLGNLQVWMRDDWRLDGVVISGQSDDNLTIHANRVILGHDAGLILNGNIVASNKTKPAKAIVSLSARGEVVINGDLTVNFPIFSLDKDSTLRVSGSFMGTLPELLTYHRSRMQVGTIQLPELTSVRNYGTVICDNDCLAPRAVFTNGERDCSTIPGVASTKGQLIVNGRCQLAELKAKKELIKQRNVCRELVQKYKQEGQDLPLFSPDEEILIIRSEMHRLAGRRLLPQFTDESDQLWQFFLNTVEEHHRLRVEDGVVLDIGRHLNWGEQCKLKKDIVWMVEFNCDGQKTYAIRLYLCQETMKSLYVNPAMVIAGSFNLTADSNWANQGLMEATRGDVNIQVPGGMLLNQGGGILSRTGAVNLSSGVGIANTNGLIQGATGVAMQAPLIMSETQVGREGSNQQFHSITGGEAEIRSGGDIRLDAKEQLVVTGSQIAADGDITLSSGDVLQVMPAVLEYHDEAHEADSSHLIHHRSGIYPALTGRNIELQSRNKLTLVAPTIYGIEEVSVKSSHGLMQIHPFIEMDYAHYTWYSSDFWGSSDGQKTEMKEKVERPKIQAGRKLTLKAHDDLETVAMEARTRTMHLESTRGQVKLGAGRERSMRQEQYRTSGWITTTNHDEGYNHLEVIEPILVYDDVRVVGRLMAEVKKGQLAPWVVDLCHVYEVDLREVLEQHEQWREHTTTMSTPLRTFLMVGLAICTAGWGAEYVATHWASTSTAIAKGAGAALEGITNTLSVSTLANAGDLGKVFKEISNSNYLKNLVASAVSAGLVSKFV